MPRVRNRALAVGAWLAAGLALAGAFNAGAQQPAAPPLPGASTLLLYKVPARLGMSLKVSSPAFAAGGDIPPRNTQFQANAFPGLAWTGAPSGVKSYAVVMQDADVVGGGAALVHWILFDVPSAAKGLPAGLTSPPPGSHYGFDYLGPRHAYAGPKPPPGPKHHYHFQVFALDAALPAAAGDSLDKLSAAMTSHVVASGETVGLGGSPATP